MMKNKPKNVEQFYRHLDWNLLYIFLVVTREGGVSAAAEKLSITQPAVSNSIKRLETQLERVLIDRTQTRFTLTTSGELLFGECKEVFGTISRISTVLRDVKDQVVGEITLAMLTHVKCPLLDQVLEEFHIQNPNAKIRININTSSEVVEEVNRKEASAGICFMNNNQYDLEEYVLYTEKFEYFCGRPHKLYKEKNIGFKSLEREDIVTFPTDSPTGELKSFSMTRASHGMSGNIIGTSPYLEEVERMIIAGIGIGPLPVHVVSEKIGSGELWPIQKKELNSVFEVRLLVNPRTRLNRAESLFIDMLIRKIKTTPISERTYT